MGLEYDETNNSVTSGTMELVMLGRYNSKNHVRSHLPSDFDVLTISIPFYTCIYLCHAVPY